MRLRVPVPLAALLATTLAASASADKSPKGTAHLVYVRGDLAQCPDEGEVRDAVAARLGYDPFDRSSPTTVTAVITRTRAGLRAHVEIRNASTGTGGVREITSGRSDCTELASAMELAISIAIDPRSMTRPAGLPPPNDEPVPLPTPHSAVAPTSPDIIPSTPRQTPVQPPPPQILFGAMASLGYGTTPSASVAPVLFVGLRNGWMSLRIDGRFYLPAAEDASPTGSVHGSLLGGAVAPCVHFGAGAACAILLLGRFHGEGRGVDVPKEQNAVYVASGVRVGLEWPLGQSLFVPLYAEALLPITREKLRLRDQVVWDNPAVTIAALLGLGVHL